MLRRNHNFMSTGALMNVANGYGVVLMHGVSPDVFFPHVVEYFSMHEMDLKGTIRIEPSYHCRHEERLTRIAFDLFSLHKSWSQASGMRHEIALV